MTIEDLKKEAMSALEFGIRRMKEKGNLDMMFLLVKCAGGIDALGVDPAIVKNEDAKRQLGREMKARVAAGGIEAVIMIADTFVAENMDRERDMLRQTLGLTVKQAADAGLCSVYEAVTMTLESPMITMAGRQRYSRGPNDTIELVGEPVIWNSAEGTGEVLPGRFSGFWPAAGGRPS